MNPQGVGAARSVRVEQRESRVCSAHSSCRPQSPQIPPVREGVAAPALPIQQGDVPGETLIYLPCFRAKLMEEMSNEPS